MNTTLVYGLLLALGNGLICISIPALVSYSQRKLKQSQEQQSPVITHQSPVISHQSPVTSHQ